MSQHVFSTSHDGKAVDVVAGYDRLLGGFFMDIDDGEDEPLYTHLEEVNPNPSTMRPFLQKLDELGITVPPQMIAEIEQDRRFDVGNKIVLHGIDGSTYTRQQDGREIETSPVIAQSATDYTDAAVIASLSMDDLAPDGEAYSSLIRLVRGGNLEVTKALLSTGHMEPEVFMAMATASIDTQNPAAFVDAFVKQARSPELLASMHEHIHLNQEQSAIVATRVAAIYGGWDDGIGTASPGKDAGPANSLPAHAVDGKPAGAVSVDRDEVMTQSDRGMAF